MAASLLSAIGVYAAIGVVVALYFVMFGLGRFGPVTIGARLLLIPAAIGLWPYIMKRLLS